MDKQMPDCTTKIMPHDVMSAYDAVANVYDDVFRSTQAVKEQVGHTLALLRQIGARRVIDVSAGTGTEALPVWRDGDLELLVASDANSSMLGQLRQRAAYCGTVYRNGWMDDTAAGLVVMQADWWTLDQLLPVGTFDAVVCTGISFYQCYTIKGFISALQCWGRLLKAGGVVLVDYMNQDEECAELRRDSCATQTEPAWGCSELTSSSGRRYVVTDFHMRLPLAEAPIGWQTWNTWIVAELDGMRRAMNLRTLSGGGAMLDPLAVADLAPSAGFSVADPDRSTPSLDVPARNEVLPMHRSVLRKL